MDCSFLCKWTGLACQEICARAFQHMHTSGYILQSSMLPPWQAPVINAEEHEVSLFFLSTLCAQQANSSPGGIVLLPIANSIEQTPVSDTAKLNLRHIQTLSDTLQSTIQQVVNRRAFPSVFL